MTALWVAMHGADYEVPDVIAQAEGIEDVSDNRGIAPCFGRDVDGVQVLVFADHPDPAKRDYPDVPRFLVTTVVWHEEAPWWPAEWPEGIPDETGCLYPQDYGQDTEDPEAAMVLFMAVLTRVHAMRAAARRTINDSTTEHP